MFNNSAFDVVIGLVFIYLLYSLLVTVVAEILATHLGLRARNLKEAINRMLNDEDEDKGFFSRLTDSLRLMKNPKNTVITNFYNHPEIKYLGSSGLFKNPSSFKAVSFSKTLLYLLNENGSLTAAQVEEVLRKKAPGVLGPETASYVLNIWQDAEKDVTKFKQQLEAWFDRTMEQATEWYKRKIQIILFMIGFSVAWIFNADTIAITSKLSTDKVAREKLVHMAEQYLEKNKTAPETVAKKLALSPAQYSKHLDSLQQVKAALETQLTGVNNLLGTGSWLPDTLFIKTQLPAKNKLYSVSVEEDLLQKMQYAPTLTDGKHAFDIYDKIDYFLLMLFKHFAGFMLTALAVSLGAPFWFDLLNKVMKLRTSIKQATGSTNTNTDNTVLPSYSN